VRREILRRPLSSGKRIPIFISTRGGGKKYVLKMRGKKLEVDYYESKFIQKKHRNEERGKTKADERNRRRDHQMKGVGEGTKKRGGEEAF